MTTSSPHSGRKHSKFAASSMNRIVACPGSVALSEGLPDTESAASREGTKCHEVLEHLLKEGKIPPSIDQEMLGHAMAAATYINYRDESADDLLIETKVSLSFIHPEAFGTLDAAVVQHFGTLDIVDFKYGRHLVQAKNNLQLIFYALGVAHLFDWNFKRVRLTIIQPRVRGYDGPTFSELTIPELKEYIPFYKKAFHRAEEEMKVYAEGEHCFFCKARGICPLKKKAKSEAARLAFKDSKPF